MTAAVLDRTIIDRNTGETVTFVETAAETGGARVVMDISLAPRTVVPVHAHPIQESFECTAGVLRFDLGRKPVDLGPGQSVTARPGDLHGIRNESADPATLRVIATPGAAAEYGLRMKFLMSRDGFLPKPGGGPPKHLLLGAVLIDRAGMYFPPLPRWLFHGLMGSLATVGRWRGRERFLIDRYPEYALYLEALRPAAIRSNESEV
jgi:quercetin dioxygenase-like cupin family protein